MHEATCGMYPFGECALVCEEVDEFLGHGMGLDQVAPLAGISRSMSRSRVVLIGNDSNKQGFVGNVGVAHSHEALFNLVVGVV